jgi:hypothetical protein
METPYKVLPKGRRRVTLNTQTPEYEIEYPYIPQPGDKIAQGLFIPNPTVAPTEVQELPGSERGTGGFGSTDEALKAAIEDPLVIFQALVQHSCPGAGLPAEDGNVCPDCGMTVGRTSEGKLCFHPRKA